MAEGSRPADLARVRSTALIFPSGSSSGGPQWNCHDLRRKLRSTPPRDITAPRLLASPPAAAQSFRSRYFAREKAKRAEGSISIAVRDSDARRRGLANSASASRTGSIVLRALAAGNSAVRLRALVCAVL